MTPCASRSNAKLPERRVNWRSVTELSRWIKNDTSASNADFCSGGQSRSTCDIIFCKYSGNGNATPSVLTVATSLPVDGFSPGSGVVDEVVRGAASRRVWSCVGGGVARETVLCGRLAAGVGGGGGNQADAIRRRKSRSSAGRAEQQHDHEPVNEHGSRHRHTYGGRSAAASSHRLIVSGSATSPTSCTPALRITASTCTTRA